AARRPSSLSEAPSRRGLFRPRHEHRRARAGALSCSASMMRFLPLWLRVTSCAASCAVLCACSGSGDGGGTGGSTGGSPPTPLDHATVCFEDEGALAIATGETRALGVVGEPAAPYRVGFSLVGEALGGWVDPPMVMADPTTGHAVVELHAPAQATTFHVRAS